MVRVIPVLLLLAALPAGADIRGKVVSVADGDTVAVRDVHRVKHTVNLACTNAPGQDQSHGEASKAHLASMIAGRIVTVTNAVVDSHGHTTGIVQLRDQNVNLQMVRDGFARHDPQEGCGDEFSSAESDARSAALGLWQDN